MSIATVHSERTIEQLIITLYGKLPAAHLDFIKDAILRANPQLDESGTLEPGTAIVVPSIPAEFESAIAGDSASGKVAKAISDALSSYRRDLVGKIDHRKQELDGIAETLKGDPFRKGGKNTIGAEWVQGLKETSETEQAELARNRIFIEQELEIINNGLERLANKLT